MHRCLLVSVVPPACHEPGLSPRACVHAPVRVICLPRWAHRLGMLARQCVTLGDHRTQTSGSCQPLPGQLPTTSLFSSSQMSPRCSLLPAWLRAMDVRVYFG